MDMFINSYDSFILDSEEIDLVCDLIENVFYGKFLKKKGALMGIHCTGQDYEGNIALDRVIHCRNKTDPGIEKICEALAIERFYANFCEAYKNDLDAQAINIQQGHLPKLNTNICVAILRVTDGDITTYGAIKGKGKLKTKELRACQYALVMSLYMILECRHNTVNYEILGSLVNYKDEQVSKEEREEILKRVIDALNSDRKPAVKWRESLSNTTSS